MAPLTHYCPPMDGAVGSQLTSQFPLNLHEFFKIMQHLNHHKPRNEFYLQKNRQNMHNCINLQPDPS
jgi:hypothetical protein